MKRAGGFTLIEMMVTVALVAILASVVVPLSQLGMQRSKERELKAALREIRTAIDKYKDAVDAGRVYASADASGYPPSLKVLVQGAVDQKDPAGRKIYFLRRIPRDPFWTDGGAESDATWGKRSYRSEADAPREGEDVYDVFSMSSKVGLDGRPYRAW